MPGFIKDLAQIDEKFATSSFYLNREIEKRKERKRENVKLKKNREQDTILIASLQNSCFFGG